MTETSGWLLDLYENLSGGITLWFITENNERLQLFQDFSAAFYVYGKDKELHCVEQFLNAQPIQCQYYYTYRRDLYLPKAIHVLSIHTLARDIKTLFRIVSKRFPQLEYYDADISIQLRHAAEYGTFPLAFCHITYYQNKLLEFQVIEGAWTLDPKRPPLRSMFMEPDCDPRFSQPKFIEIKVEKESFRYDIGYTQSSLLRLAAHLKKYDPDFLVTRFGDTWLLPFLISATKHEKLQLPLNRDLSRAPLTKKEGSYLSYGRYIYRGQQVLLYGRCHIDGQNAMLWQDYELESALEMARVTSLPIQTAARASPGTGINSMEIRSALRQSILVPWHKTHGEEVKTASELLHSDQGGLVYQPIAGLHESVGMIDFISLYPSIMTYCNISPEKPIPHHLEISQDNPGLIPQTLRPLLEKRIALKQRTEALSPDDPRYKPDKSRSAALKMLLVCCFGYLGYKAAKFGRIESHEAISALGREALLTAKEAAEDLGFRVLHLYVDGIWVKKENAKSKEDFACLLNEISRRTSLPIALDAFYRWVAFLPSQADARMSVPNRYFGLKQNGVITVRGMDIRKHDTPHFIARFQQDLLNLLSNMDSARQIYSERHKLLELYQKRYFMLRSGTVRIDDLVVQKRVTREANSYRVASATAITSRQLAMLGQEPRLGQRISFVYTLGSPGVTAWHARLVADAQHINFAYYCTLLSRAAFAILQPLGINRSEINEYEGKPLLQKSLFIT